MTGEGDACPPEAAGGNNDMEIPADPTLVAEGWVRRFLADPLRAQEAIEVYTSLGYEVKAQALTPADFGSQCGGCAEVACRSHVLIYTRKIAP